jgi:hypothetical protein
MWPEGDERAVKITVPPSDADRPYSNNVFVTDVKHSEVELPEETIGNGACISP